MSTPPAAARDAEHLRRLNALLEHALELPDAERAGWLHALPEPDRALAAPLQALLGREAVETDHFMRQTPQAVADLMEAALAVEDRRGDCIGPWRLLRALGRGGMSTVWVAERIDASPAREVALKVPREGWARGLAQRMARERDLLAALQHPNIARLYDAGIAADGRPWLAMELVDGEPIDAWCAHHDLGLRDRLALVLQVCDALTHAHGRLIVHRDLKPANIMVCSDGTVRLLDFGVGKLLAADVRAAGDLTQVLGRAVTPDYASPEQVADGPVTVASDVYSLGVVAYELLTGQRPYRLGHCSTAALEEAILAADIAPASTRAADARTARALRGDLDAILNKALDKTPAQRYGSVEALAADLRAHLAGLPVQAQRPHWGYRARKFVRRNRLPILLATATLLLMAGALWAQLWQLAESRRQAEIALARQAEAEAVADFASRVLTETVGRDESLTLDQIVQRSEQMVRVPNPVQHALAALTVAGWFNDYGSYDRAERLLSQTLARLPADLDPALLNRLRCSRADAWSSLGRHDEAVAEFDAAIAATARLPAAAADCLLRRAYLARNANDAAGALHYAQAARDAYQAGGRRSASLRAMIEAEIGYALMLGRRPVQAQQRYDTAMRLFEASGSSESPEALNVRNNRAVAYIDAGQPLRALRHLNEAVAISRQRSPTGEAPIHVVANLGQALRASGRFEEALATFEVGSGSAARGHEPGALAYTLIGAAVCLLDLGRLDVAIERLDAARRVLAAAGLPPDSPPTLASRMAQARLWMAQGRLAEADRAMAEAQQRYDRIGAGNSSSVIAVSRAEIALAQGRHDDARKRLDEAIAQGRRAKGDFEHSSPIGQALVVLAQLHQAAGRLDAARQMARSGLEHLEPSAGPQHPHARRAQRLLAELPAELRADAPLSGR